MSVSDNTPPLSARLATALRHIAHGGAPFVATPAATRLEHDLTPLLADDGTWVRSGVVTHLESAGLTTRPVPSMEAARPIRYFLDGVQRTLPLGWCGMNALACVIIVASIIERRPQDGVFRVVPGMTTIREAVIIASAPDDPYTDALYAAFDAANIETTATNERNDASLRTGDFLALQTALRLKVSTIRDACEYEAFQKWVRRPKSAEDWLLVDGSLIDGTVPQTLGMIKRHSGFDLANDEMMAVLHLPGGYRSTAFQRTGTGRERPLTWYLRMHDPHGADPLLGLARIEAPAHTDLREIDALARLVLSERTPRATGDDRWPTLIYPIHIAERILKVKLERALLGVPAALQRYIREVA